MVSPGATRPMSGAGRLAEQDAGDLESADSFRSGPLPVKPAAHTAWSGVPKVDHESFQRMLSEYRDAKEQQKADQLKIKQLAAQLARTEEAAKRAMLRGDPSARGGAAQQLLDAQRELDRLRAVNAELTNKLARERKRAAEFRAAAVDARRGLDAALREQRALARRLGEADAGSGALSNTAARAAAVRQAAEDEYWSEEAGRRFAVQQEELVALRQQVAELQARLEAKHPTAGSISGRGAGLSGNTNPAVARYESRITELTRTLRAYEERLGLGSALGARPCSAPVKPGAQPAPTSGHHHQEQQGSSLRGSCDANVIEALRLELGRYQARVQELEADFASLTLVAGTEAAGRDDELRKAWLMAAAFKKRYVEHKLALDGVRSAAERMQQTLDETHKQLASETARRLAAEEAASRARADASRAEQLAAKAAAERADRTKLEREYLELQSKAFAGPGGAAAEARALREELFAARRERALAEAREADIRRDLASLRRQTEGVSPEALHCSQRDAADARRRVAALELELKAAHDSLDVYRRAEVATGSGGLQSSGAGPLAALGGPPDAEKTEAEVRRELAQLREVLSIEAGQREKLQRLLDTETAIGLEAKAALEEALAEAERAAREATTEHARLRRELDLREEQLRRQEKQLSTALAHCSGPAAPWRSLGGLGAASLRASRAGSRTGGGVSQSLVAASLEELGGLAPGENVVEFTALDAVLTDGSSNGLLGSGAPVFLTWDFFLHDPQATDPAPAPRPTWGAAVQYIVEQGAGLGDYLAGEAMAVELCAAKGEDYEVLGAAVLPLRQVLDDLEVAVGLWTAPATHYADIKGPAGETLGRLRYAWRVLKPLAIDDAPARRVLGVAPVAAVAGPPATVALGDEVAGGDGPAASTRLEGSAAGRPPASASAPAAEQSVELQVAAEHAHTNVAAAPQGPSPPDVPGQGGHPLASQLATQPAPLPAWLHAEQRADQEQQDLGERQPAGLFPQLNGAPYPISLKPPPEVHASAQQQVAGPTVTALLPPTGGASPRLPADLLQQAYEALGATDEVVGHSAAAGEQAAAYDDGPMALASLDWQDVVGLPVLGQQLQGLQEEEEEEEIAPTVLGDGLGQTSAQQQAEKADTQQVAGESGGGADDDGSWIMARVPAAGGPSTWPYPLSSTVYLRIDGVTLSSDALGDPQLGGTLAVAHAFLEDFTDAAAQCTDGVAKRPGWLPFSYAVAYQLLDSDGRITAAGRRLAQQLTEAALGGPSTERVVLPVLLASTEEPPGPITDFAAIDCAATCEIDLGAAWEVAAGGSGGGGGDMLRQQLELVPTPERAAAYGSGSAGTVTLSLYLSQALAGLKAAVAAEGGLG